MYKATIAKIEAGDRGVKLPEAAAMASLLGRCDRRDARPQYRRFRRRRRLLVRALADTASVGAYQVGGMPRLDANAAGRAEPTRVRRFRRSRPGRRLPTCLPRAARRTQRIDRCGKSEGFNEMTRNWRKPASRTAGANQMARHRLPTARESVGAHGMSRTAANTPRASLPRPRRPNG